MHTKLSHEFHSTQDNPQAFTGISYQQKISGNNLSIQKGHLNDSLLQYNGWIVFKLQYVFINLHLCTTIYLNPCFIQVCAMSLVFSNSYSFVQLPYMERDILFVIMRLYEIIGAVSWGSGFKILLRIFDFIFCLSRRKLHFNYRFHVS